MATLHFTTTIDINGINPYVLISSTQAHKLQKNWKKPMPVTVQVNGKPDKPWHINLMPIGDGSFYLYLHNDVRKASNTKVGDTVDVKVTFDHEYKNGPQHTMPDWFQTALNKNNVASSNWKALPPSRQKEILRYFAALKSSEAIKRNLEKVMQVLSGKKSRFMARDWDQGK